MLCQRFVWENLSPTCSCFKSPIVLCFLSIVYEVQNMAATAACQHYCGLNQRNWNPEWICHHSYSHIFNSWTWHVFVNIQPTTAAAPNIFISKSLVPFIAVTNENGSCVTTFFRLCRIVCFLRNHFVRFLLSVKREENNIDSRQRLHFHTGCWYWLHTFSKSVSSSHSLATSLSQSFHFISDTLL